MEPEAALPLAELLCGAVDPFEDERVGLAVCKAKVQVAGLLSEAMIHTDSLLRSSQQ